MPLGFYFDSPKIPPAQRRLERELLARKIPPKAAAIIAAKRAKGAKR